MKIINLLTRFGLTSQEATIYTLLCAEGELTGYEVSKRTGISRSNAYTALANLTEKGAAELIAGERKLYRATPVQEFCINHIRKIQKTAEIIYELIPEKRDQYEGYLTIQGKDNILDKMINVIASAEKRIYLSMHGSLIGVLMDHLAEAIQRDLKVVIITSDEADIPGAIVYRTNKEFNEIRLITDSRKALTGDLKDQRSTCLYSTKKNLVALLKESLTNEIELIKLRGDTE